MNNMNGYKSKWWTEIKQKNKNTDKLKNNVQFWMIKKGLFSGNKE